MHSTHGAAFDASSLSRYGNNKSSGGYQAENFSKNHKAYRVAEFFTLLVASAIASTTPPGSGLAGNSLGNGNGTGGILLLVSGGDGNGRGAIGYDSRSGDRDRERDGSC